MLRLFARKTKNTCRNETDLEVYADLKKKKKTTFSVLITSLLTSLITSYLILNNMLIILQDTGTREFELSSAQTLLTSSFY